MIEQFRPRRLLRLVPIAACALAGPAACGTDADPGSQPNGNSGAAGEHTAGDAGAGASPASSDAERFLEEYAAAVCEMYEPCCQAEQLGFDPAGCTEWFASVTRAYFTGDYRPERGAACLNALEQARAEDADRCRTVALFDEATLREECREAFGTPPRTGAGLGESCLLAGDCASSDEGSVICSSGLCLLQLRGEDGDGPCATPDRPPTVVVRCEAEDGLYCHRGENVCRPRVGGGDRCPYPGACDDSSMCVGGVCERLPGMGEECLNAVAGAGGFCAPRTVCDRVTLTCGPGLENGASCQESNECASGICVDDTCESSDFEQNLNCTG